MSSVGAVIQAHACLKALFTRTQNDAHHAFHAVDGIVLRQMADRRPVGERFRHEVARHEAGRAVMERPVEFHAAGDPGAEHADERRFDDVLLIEKVIARGLIKRGIDAPADLRQNFDFQIFVFECDDRICPIDLFLTVHPQNDLVRIGSAACALMHAIFRKHRQFFRRRFGICGNDALSDCTFYAVHTNSSFTN